jgi:hypothetical protein
MISKTSLVLTLALSTWANSALAVEKAPSVQYPKAVHGTWFVSDAAGRAACRQFLRDPTIDKFQDATVITGQRWEDWSEGESSHATPVSARRVAQGHWRFESNFNLNNDDKSVVAKNSVKFLRPGVFKETYGYQDSGVTKQATRTLFRCR